VILFYEMMHVWRVFFMPAVGFAFIAIGSLISALICRQQDCESPIPVPWAPWWVFALLALVILLALLVFYWRNRPRLGSED
jgi:disulfide bond formation protein DsbB